MRRSLFSIALLAAALSACGGDRRRADDMSWSPDQEASARPLRETEELDAPPSSQADAGAASTWVGVRHDVTIAPATQKTARCACLAVETGGPRDGKFQWRGQVPDVGDDAMVVAVSAKGVDCPGGDADETKRRASVSGVTRDGNDVIVEIEEVPEGRPIASGAIIAKPLAGGAVYVRPRNARLPYARPSPGAGRCRVSDPSAR